MPPSRVEAFVDNRQAQGLYVFTREELRDSLGKWDSATRDALRRLTEESRLARPRIGFYVIVPLEYRSAGSPPASWFVDPLMKYLEQSYYVGLLTAASLHGTAHHRPQEFQVVTDRPTRPVRSGRVRLRFVVNSEIDRVAVTSVNSATGTIRVSTPAATALDLVRYVDVSGGYDNVAGVLAGLAEKIDPGELAEQADRVPSVVARRTGYLLEEVGAERTARDLAKRFKNRDVEPQPLDPALPKRGADRDDRWGLYVNALVEPEPA